MRSNVILLLSLSVSVLVGAQTIESLNSRLSDALARMGNKDLSSREKAFDDLMTLVSKEDSQGEKPGPQRSEVFESFFAQHPEQAGRVKLGLIQLLSSENELFVSRENISKEIYTEENSEHYAEIIHAVASLNDERTIPPLIGAMSTGGMAQRGLLKYGDKALDPLVKELQNRDGLVRATALGLCVTLLGKQNDSGAHRRVAELIKSSLNDPDSTVRSSAIRAIDCLEERKDFVPTLERVSKTDPEKMPGKAIDKGDGDEFYPVRYDARQVLRDIQNNKSCAPGS
jgi:HEAT repeat protein